MNEEFFYENHPVLEKSQKFHRLPIELTYRCVFVGYAESNCVGHTEGFLFKPTPITPCKLVLFSRTEQAVNEIWF